MKKDKFNNYLIFLNYRMILPKGFHYFLLEIYVFILNVKKCLKISKLEIFLNNFRLVNTNFLKFLKKSSKD